MPDLLNFILKELEMDPTATFSEAELVRVSKGEFEVLQQEKFLKYFQHDPENELFYSTVPGDHGNERFVRKVSGKYRAYSTESDDIAPIDLSKEDVTRWSFDLRILAERIKNKNCLSGRYDDDLGNRLFFVGTDFTVNAAILLGFFRDELTAINELSALWSKIDRHDQAIVICPFFTLSQGSKKKLSGAGIITASFDHAFDENLKLTLRLKKHEAEAVHESPQVKKDYEKHKYKSHEVITFYEHQDSNGGYVIQIGNSTEFGVPRANFVLLLFMAMTLKENRVGLVSLKETDAQGITDDRGDENRLSYLISDLRKLLRNKSKEPNKLIETIRGKSKCRLSTHPDYIREPKRSWFKRKFDELIPEVKHERQQRLDQGKRRKKT